MFVQKVSTSDYVFDVFKTEIGFITLSSSTSFYNEKTFHRYFLCEVDEDISPIL